VDLGAIFDGMAVAYYDFMRNHKKLHLAARRKFLSGLFFVLGFFTLSNAEDLTAIAVSDQNIPVAIQKENNIWQGDSLLLLHERWMHRQLSVSASYETPWQDSEVLAKISDYQEPGCASIKASFSF
jgi:hypothetical protein